MTSEHREVVTPATTEVVTTSTPAELAQRLASETEKWGLIIKEAGIKPD